MNRTAKTGFIAKVGFNESKNWVRGDKIDQGAFRGKHLKKNCQKLWNMFPLETKMLPYSNKGSALQIFNRKQKL